MISYRDYFQGRDQTYSDELTMDIRRNAIETAAHANRLLAFYAADTGDQVPWTIVSGWRPAMVNIQTPGSTIHSRHITGQAVDILDADRCLARWCVARLDLLEQCALFMEDPRWTYSGAGQHWVHLQTVSPESGHRIFVPSATRPMDPTFPVTWT